MEGLFAGTDYLWFGDLPVAQIPAYVLDQPPLYTFTDHLGTPILQTDADADVVWRAEYEPYGEVYAYRAGDSAGQILRLAGQEVDELMGEDRYYNIFRWYRAGWGRYTQADPLLQFTTRTELHDDYTYALRNPARLVDPLGLFIVDGSCKKCESLDPKSKDMSDYIIPKVSAWCKTKLTGVKNVALRKCMTQRCASGEVKCESDCELGVYGKAPGAFSGKLGTLITKVFPTNTAVVC